MCGIVGYIGRQAALPILVQGLEKLEYRGYDSAGVAFLLREQVKVVKKKGRLAGLAGLLSEQGWLGDDPRQVNIGIGHTRWATHGAPSDENAHPHISANGRIAVVHNGIVENEQELRIFLSERGYKFLSETDSEVIAHLVEYHYSKNRNQDIVEAVRQTVNDLEGSYALGVLCADCPECMVAARKDSPLIIALGDGYHMIASDIPAVLSHSRRTIILEDRDIACLTRDSLQLYDSLGRTISREAIDITWDSEAAEKGGYEHFMIKEIHEEPKAVRDTLMSHIRGSSLILPEIADCEEWLRKVERVQIVACGTAYHAGIVGKYLLESLCRCPVAVDYASEFRYLDPIINENTLVIIISQSGETLDTLAALREAKARQAKILALVNVIGSSIAREADYVLYTRAGPEIAVASTKAYSTQLAAMYLLTFHLAVIWGRMDKSQLANRLAQVLELPGKLEQTLAGKDSIQRFASEHFNARSIFFIGRNLDYALAMEASLKLKEISYIHSEAYAGGELKHGTIALIEDGTLVVCPLTQPRLLDKMISNIREVRARGAVVLGILTPDCRRGGAVCDTVIELPAVDPLFAPLLAVTPAQLFAYYMSVNKGLDVDKPRNLAKSVTVE